VQLNSHQDEKFSKEPTFMRMMMMIMTMMIYVLYGVLKPLVTPYLLYVTIQKSVILNTCNIECS